MKQQAVLLPTQKKKPCTNRNKKWEKDVAFWLWIVLMMQMKPCRPKRTLQAWPLQRFVAKTFTKLKSSFRMIMRPITRKFEWVCGTGGTLGSLNMWCLSQLFSLVDSIRKSYLISMELCRKSIGKTNCDVLPNKRVYRFSCTNWQECMNAYSGRVSRRKVWMVSFSRFKFQVCMNASNEWKKWSSLIRYSWCQ